MHTSDELQTILTFPLFALLSTLFLLSAAVPSPFQTLNARSLNSSAVHTLGVLKIQLQHTTHYLIQYTSHIPS
jgi:hypothetical protein